MKILFIRNNFKLSDKGTWMAPFIRGVLNADNKKKGIENIRFNHLALELDGCVYEAGYNRYSKKAEVFKRSFTDWMADREQGTYEAFQIPLSMYPYSKDTIKMVLNPFMKTPYDFFGVLVVQLIRQISGKRVWLGKKGKDFSEIKGAVKRLHCANFVSVVLNIIFDIQINKHLLSTDPEDIYDWCKKHLKQVEL